MAANTTVTGNGVVLVQVQTLRGNAGVQAAFAQVQAAVTAYNKANPRATPHTCTLVPQMPNNTKGMQAALALLATLARHHGANMVRLGVHNANVALCGTPAALKAVQAGFTPLYNTMATAAASSYNPATHGNRVGYTNGYMCGYPAGLQVAWGVTASLAYGVGFLYAFAAPGSGASYATGQNAGKAAAPKAPKAPATAPKAPKAPKAPANGTTATTAPANGTTASGNAAAA